MTRSKKAKPLPLEIPIHGPRFVSPTYLSLQKRKSTFNVEPQTSYIRPLTIIHPYYFPKLGQCPHCDSDDLTSEGWNSYGYRDVHGISYEETALGVQLSCKACQKCGTESKEKVPYRFSTTNVIFWEKRDFWGIPRKHDINRKKISCYSVHNVNAGGIPYFFKRCAITQELFHLIIELRLASTAAGLAEHFKRE